MKQIAHDLWVYRAPDRHQGASDRYAIRTRNLQDWNLTRYRCANRSKAAKQEETRPRYLEESCLLRDSQPSELAQPLRRENCLAKLPAPRAAKTGLGLARESFACRNRGFRARQLGELPPSLLQRLKSFDPRSHVIRKRHTSEKSQAMPWKPGQQVCGPTLRDAQRCRGFGQQKRRPRVRFSGEPFVAHGRAVRRSRSQN